MLQNQIEFHVAKSSVMLIIPSAMSKYDLQLDESSASLRADFFLNSWASQSSPIQVSQKSYALTLVTMYQSHFLILNS